MFIGKEGVVKEGGVRDGGGGRQGGRGGKKDGGKKVNPHERLILFFHCLMF